ncbi:hypothetical protein ABL78_2994 [Leptomonas seymouri]|uniref:Uncharacterized protein n=1 Tax=Leptomonas seymouri TaxID=5684 RepID=A0A0N0P6Q6_LEPSE|nr:hypothetical protein ABL78_2994 [Leptomonas seymouri]|eukprot:KPI87916.1 hypothetical protein ABL78_2994 [Leptomonas seymouri]
MQRGNGFSVGGDGDSVPRSSSIVTRAGPAPVLSEASIRRKREHSRQASLDMMGREQFNVNSGNGGHAHERSASYMAQTESSLRHASIGSDASITGSIRRLRQQQNADRDDDASDVASVTSSQWSMRRRRVGPRPLQKVEKPVPGATAERARRMATDTTATRLPGNQAVLRGGAHIAASRKSAAAVSEGRLLNTQSMQRTNLPASGVASSTVTTITVSDDESVELTKSAASVSLSPITPGTRSDRKSAHHTRRLSGSGSKSASDLLSGADTEATRDVLDAHDEPVPRTAQPVSFDGLGGGGYTSAGQWKSAPGTDKGGRPPLTPRGDTSPGAGGVKRSSSSLGVSATVPATTLTSNTVHRPSNGFDYQQQHQRMQQRRNSAGEAAAATRSFNSGTTIHRFTEDRGPASDHDAVGQKPSYEDSIDDTPIGVLKERANREAERNAQRGSNQPVIPRLALSEITAKRDRSRHAHSHDVAHDGSGHYGPDTPMTGDSVLSDVTVSTMTGSDTPHVHVAVRSSRSHPPGQRRTQGADARADRSPLTSAAQQKENVGGGDYSATYDSHSKSPAPEEEAVNIATTVSRSRVTAVEATANRSEGNGHVASAPSPMSTTTKNTKAPTQGGAKATTEANGAGGKRVSEAAARNKGRTSPTPAVAPARSDAGEPRRRRAFEVTSAAAPREPTLPPATSSKEKPTCCAVM